MGAIRTVILGVWTQRNPMQESHPELDGKGQKKKKKVEDQLEDVL